MYTLKIERTYLEKGTNGIISYDGKEICKCVELPWFDNRPRISCIPEGFYDLMIRNTDALEDHFYVPCVPDRNYILIHHADVVKRELQGCIIPVIRHTGQGLGIHSAEAMQKLRDVLLPDFFSYKPVKLLITSKTGVPEIVNGNLVIDGNSKANQTAVSKA